MMDMSTLARLYDEMCALWRSSDPDAYRRACDLFLAHGRYLRSKATGNDLLTLEGQITRWQETAPFLPSEKRCRKIAYVSRMDASRTAKSVQAAKGGRQDFYLCPHCRLWHLTSKSRRQYRQHVREHVP